MRINAKIMILVAAGLVLTSVVIAFLAVWQLNRSSKMPPMQSNRPLLRKRCFPRQDG